MHTDTHTDCCTPLPLHLVNYFSLLCITEASSIDAKQRSVSTDEDAESSMMGGKRGISVGKKSRKKDKEKDQQESQVLYDKVRT